MRVLRASLAGLARLFLSAFFLASGINKIIYWKEVEKRLLNVLGDWQTYWTSLMSVSRPGPGARPSIRFRHIRGVTTGMDVEWTFEPGPTVGETLVRIVHVWNGPRWPLIGDVAARGVIGPVFVHGIASRTLAGLARVAER